MIGPVRHLVIGAAGNRLAQRVQTISTSRWTVINTTSRPMRHDSRSPFGPPDRSLGPSALNEDDELSAESSPETET
jgi:hypothetical protein